MMFAYIPKATFAATTALSALALAAPAAAQTVSTGTSGGVTGQDVSASTCGSGSTDATSVQVSGCADAEALNGGTASTRTQGTANDRRAMQKSTAVARDEDERARSMTRTRVRQGEVVSSRTMSKYKQRGERPVIERQTSTATPSGTTTKTTPPKK